MEKSIVLIYEQAQVGAVAAYVQNIKTPVQVVALDYWAERELVARGVACAPLTEFCSDEALESLLLEVQRISHTWYQLPEMQFFVHQGVSIGEATNPALAEYLQRARYYLYVIEQICKAHPDATQLVIPVSSQHIPHSTRAFTAAEIRVVNTVGAVYAKQAGLAFENLGELAEGVPTPFVERSVATSLLLRAYNACMQLFSSRQATVIYASDHWRNISSVVHNLKSAELIFFDRAEIRALSWKDLWKYRVRFLHPLDVATARTRRVAHEKQHEFAAAWQKAREVVGTLNDFSYSGGSWWPAVAEGFDALVNVYAERIVSDIEAIGHVLTTRRIGRVLVRAGASGQHHFFLLGTLPKRYHIPSLEIQHGIGVGIQDPQSAFAKLNVDYIAAYGSLVRDWFVRWGYAPERIIPTGSPRFDQYPKWREAMTPEIRATRIRELGLDPTRPVILSVVQEEMNLLMPFAFTSYELRDYFLAIAKTAKEIPEAQFILKFRSEPLREQYAPYCKEIFGDRKIALVSEGNAYQLSLLCGMTYSCYSTVALEAIEAGKPVVLFPFKKRDVYFIEAFKDGAVYVQSDDELVTVTRALLPSGASRDAQIKKGKQFIASHFMFDGNAAEHVAEVIDHLPVPTA